MLNLKKALTELSEKIKRVSDSSPSNIYFGSYVYRGDAITQFTVEDPEAKGGTYVIASCQDAGVAIERILRGTGSMTVYLARAASTVRINYLIITP